MYTYTYTHVYYSRVQIFWVQSLKTQTYCRNFGAGNEVIDHVTYMYMYFTTFTAFWTVYRLTDIWELRFCTISGSVAKKKKYRREKTRVAHLPVHTRKRLTNDHSERTFIIRRRKAVTRCSIEERPRVYSANIRYGIIRKIELKIVLDPVSKSVGVWWGVDRGGCRGDGAGKG